MKWKSLLKLALVAIAGTGLVFGLFWFNGHVLFPVAERAEQWVLGLPEWIRLAVGCWILIFFVGVSASPSKNIITERKRSWYEDDEEEGLGL